MEDKIMHLAARGRLLLIPVAVIWLGIKTDALAQQPEKLRTPTQVTPPIDQVGAPALDAASKDPAKMSIGSTKTNRLGSKTVKGRPRN
jgi:hypothetical protein